jgi:hypothetical protein
VVPAPARYPKVCAMPKAKCGADLPEIKHSSDAQAQFEKSCAPARWSDFNTILRSIYLRMQGGEATGVQKGLATLTKDLDRQLATLKALDMHLRDALVLAAGGAGPLNRLLCEQVDGLTLLAGWAETARRSAESGRGRKAESKHILAVALARMLADAGLTLEVDKGGAWRVAYGLAIDALGLVDGEEKNTLARAYDTCRLNGWWSSEGVWIPH